MDFRCEELEADLIRKNASECGLSTSNYCRQVILGYRPRKRLTDEELETLTDVRKLCADMVHINNFFRQGKYPKMMASGLCHSVQGTASMLARWIGAKDEDITYTCMGINHQAFYREFLWKVSYI